jgi:hypothetical protein
MIHDDHTNLWVKMNATALSQWFTALDICMLDINRANIDVKEFRSKNCSKHASGNGVSSHRLFCGIGSSLGRPCAAPLSTRYFFQYRLFGELGNPSSGSLKNALKRIAESKRALVFIGDALSKQNQEALVCEAMRTDKIWISGDVYGGNSHTAVTSFTMHWKDRPTLTLDVVFIHVAHISDDSKDAKLANSALGSFVNDETPGRRRGLRAIGDHQMKESSEIRQRKLYYKESNRRQLLELYGGYSMQTNLHPHNNSGEASDARYSNGNEHSKLHERSDEHLHGGNSRENTHRSLGSSSSGVSSSSKSNSRSRHTDTEAHTSTNTSLYEHNSPSMTLDAVKSEVDKLKGKYPSGLILIANVGVWYNSREQFRKDLPSFMHWLDGIGKAKQNLVFFRETAAQHWNHTGTYY